jgi:hypothetical protein
MNNELYKILIKEYTALNTNTSKITLKNIINDIQVQSENNSSEDLNLTEIFNTTKQNITSPVEVELQSYTLSVQQPEAKQDMSKRTIPVHGSFNTLNIIKQPQLLTERVFHGSIKASIKGGSDIRSNILNTNIDTVIDKNRVSIQKINKLLFNSNTKTLEYIFTYYFNNYTQKINDVIIPKILNNQELLLIIASSIYVFFIDKKYTDIDEIINPIFVNSIPEHFKFNFLNLIEKKLSETNFSTLVIQELVYSLSQDENNQNTIPVIFSDKYNITVYNPMQSGGKVNNIEELIQQKINTLSLRLKNKQKGGEISMKTIIHDINKYVHLLGKINKYHTQRGGKISVEDMTKQKISAEEELTKIKSDALKVKVHTQKMIDKANIWAVELINQGVAVKEIEDNEYGIARFILSPLKEEDKSNGEISAVLGFINDTASILRFKNEVEKSQFHEIISTPQHLGNARPSYITDKLTKYYQKKYEELQKLKDTQITAQSNYQEKESSVFDQLRQFLGFRGGNPSRDMILNSEANFNIYNTDFLEHCFTSKQYVKFLDKMKSYLKDSGKTIEIKELEGLKEEIDQVKKIEEHLLEINKLLVNYKLITDQFPENIKKDITFQHMKNILQSNNSLIDEYGDVNLKTLGVVKNIERYLDIKEELNEELKDPNVRKEVNELIQKQSGGGIQTFNKKYMVNNDYEFFTTTTFQNVLASMDKEKDKN